MNFKRTFLNIDEARLRSGWRILVTVVGMMAVFLPIQWLLKLLLPDSWTKEMTIDFLLAIFAIIATIVIRFARIRIDKRSFLSLGLSRARPVIMDTTVGFLISGTLVGIVVALEMSFGWLTFEFGEQSWSDSLPQILSLFLVSGFAVSWWENLFFVSYLLLNVRDGLGLKWSIVLNIVIAAAIHGANPNASIAAVLGIGLIHSYEIFGFMRTRALWLILGVHAGWNFFQGLAGFPVSGRMGIQAINQVNSTPAWFGGGEFGPEAGVVVILTGGTAYLLIYLYSKWTSKKDPATDFG